MSTGIATAPVGAVAAVLTLWIGPLMWLAQKIDAQRNHLDGKIDDLAKAQREDYKALSAQQRSDHQHLVSLILQIQDRKGSQHD